MDEYLDRIYNEAFDREYNNLMLRKATDQEFTKEYLEGLLQSLYIQQGNNYADRAEGKENALRAMIAAAEMILIEWE